MGLQPLLNQEPQSMVEIFASRMHVLWNIICIFLLDVPTNSSLHTHARAHAHTHTHARARAHMHTHVTHIGQFIYLWFMGNSSILIFPTRIFIVKESSS